MENLNDFSESSSVRMEREMHDTSAISSSHHSEDDQPEETTHSSSSLQDFDTEIQRLTRDADKILESIRNEVRNDTKPKKTSTDLLSSNNPESVSPCAIASPETDGDGNEDDGMMDELERLDSVTNTIRLSLDAKDADTMPRITSPLKSPQSDNEPDIIAERLAKSECQSLATPHNSSKGNATVGSGNSILSPSKLDKQLFQSESSRPETSVRSTTCSTPDIAVGRSDVDATENVNMFLEIVINIAHHKLLPLAVAIVWVSILWLFVHAKYQLLDEDGVWRLPNHFG